MVEHGTSGGVSVETVLACPDGESDGGKGRKGSDSDAFSPEMQVSPSMLQRDGRGSRSDRRKTVPLHHDQKGRPSQRGSQILHILDRVCEGLAGRANTGRAKA